MKIEFEFSDGTFLTEYVDDIEVAHERANEVERTTGWPVVSAWRDDEPWFGQCTAAARPHWW